MKTMIVKHKKKKREERVSRWSWDPNPRHMSAHAASCAVSCPPCSVLVVQGAGWDRANGTYHLASAAEYPSCVAYKNSQGFLVSRESHGDWGGWILGLAGHPLYVSESLATTPPEMPGAWRAVPTWGKEPAPSMSIESLQQTSAETVVPSSSEEKEARHPQLQFLLGKAAELKRQGDEVHGPAMAPGHDSYESAAASYSAALRLLEPLEDSLEDSSEDSSEDSRGELEAATTELREALQGLAARAMDQVTGLLGEESLVAGSQMEELLSFANRVLIQAKASEALRVELEALQGAAAEAKVCGLRASGDAAAERGDWQEADACWAAALNLITPSQETAPALPGLHEELTTARRFAAVTMAGMFLKQGDECQESGDIFNADRLFSDAIGLLPTEDTGVAPLRCAVLLKRAEVLHRKWQYKDALDDCMVALRLGFERPRALCLAAEACRALSVQDAKDAELGDMRNHWMDMAVRYLEEACALRDDAVLQRRLRAWRREVPPRASPVPMPPFDWSTVPKIDKANYFGYVERRVKLSEEELQRIWEALPKESADVHGARIGKATFIQALRRFSGETEEEEAQALFQEADRDHDGLLTFGDFQQLLQLDGAK